MRLMNSKLAFFILLGGSVWAQNPEIKINGASQARFGFSTSINIQIVRNDVKGPARLIAHLPEGWTLLNPLAETALYSQTGNDAKADFEGGTRANAIIVGERHVGTRRRVDQTGGGFWRASLLVL